jgi:regulator of RNase E activity RraA
MPLTDQERPELEALNSGQLSDARYRKMPAKTARPGSRVAAPGSKIVGMAVTLRHQDLSRKIAQKGEVVVVDNGGRLDTATWGEFHTYACKQNGVAGAIIDGATRDGPEIRSSGFPTLVRGLTPVSSKWDLKTASINEPVMLGLVQVNPGDIVFADETGILVIPADKKDLVLSKAKEIRADEDRQRAKIA